MQQVLHQKPYNGTNNRKKTKARNKAISKIQSIPVFEKDIDGYVTGCVSWCL